MKSNYSQILRVRNYNVVTAVITVLIQYNLPLNEYKVLKSDIPIISTGDVIHHQNIQQLFTILDLWYPFIHTGTERTSKFHTERPQPASRFQPNIRCVIFNNYK